jgi:hypothetical protein
MASPNIRHHAHGPILLAADRVTLIGVVINLVLSAGKFTVGVSCHSSALIADVEHSLSDLFSESKLRDCLRTMIIYMDMGNFCKLLEVCSWRSP